MDLLNVDTLISLLTLMVLEVVLGIDNIIFISIVSDKLPAHQQRKARILGLTLALVLRLVLLFAISWITRLTKPWGEFMGYEITGQNLILLAGGLFLIAKSTTELHGKVRGLPENQEDPGLERKKFQTFGSAIFQIVMLDMIFSFDSILTAIGLVNQISIMVIAIVFAILVMLIFARKISNFINQNPTLKVLALSFLIMIGVVLVADGLGHHVPKGYIYFSLAFSLLVEFLNLKMRRNLPEKPVKSEE